MKRLCLLCGGLVFAAAACEGSYIYRPEENATAQVKGQPAASYPLPSTNNQQGDIRVASFGVAKMTPESGTPSGRALHVRFVVSNNSKEVWTVDTREQRIALQGQEKLRPGFAQSDTGDLPIVTVQPLGKRTIDLYFPLAVGISKESKLPSFDVLWRVHTPEQEVTERTPFQRLQIDTLYASSYWGYPYTYGPYSWYDPFWGPATYGSPSWYW